MSDILRLPDLALGDLELEVLETLWAHGEARPADVHRRLGASRRITVNTVASALKRLVDKGLLARRKVSHAYIYRAVVTRSELQRQMLDALATRFGAPGRAGLMAAFVDLTESRGEDELRELEALVAARLEGDA